MIIDPVAVLRPARAAEWTTALIAAAAGVPGDAGTRALGLAAALAVGLGHDDQAAQCLGQLRRQAGLGPVIAAALAPDPAAPTAEQVASLSPRDRDWAVLQCYRAGRDVPSALVRRVHENGLVVRDGQASVELLADAALASDDPGSVVAGLEAWMRRLHVEGLDNRTAAIAAKPPFARVLVRLGLRGWIDRIDPSSAGSTYAIFDEAAPGEAWPSFVRIVDRLVQVGHSGWVERFVQHIDDHTSEHYGPPGPAHADELRAALLRHGLIDEAAASLAKVLAQRAAASADPAGDGNRLLPVAPLPLPILDRFLDVARAAPPSAARTATMAQIARMSTAAAGADLVAEVAALIEGQRLGKTPPDLSKDEASATAQALLDLALAVAPTDQAQAREFVRDAEALADPDGPMDWLDRARIGRLVSSVLDQLHPSQPATAPQPPGSEVLARQGAWQDAIALIPQGREKFPWVSRARRLAELSADLDRPDVLGAIMGAVDRLPLSDYETARARGLVLRECLSADVWAW